MSSTYWGERFNKMAVKEKEDNIIATIWLVNNFLEKKSHWKKKLFSNLK